MSRETDQLGGKLRNFPTHAGITALTHRPHLDSPLETWISAQTESHQNKMNRTESK